jgi:hypothetical protein
MRRCNRRAAIAQPSDHHHQLDILSIQAVREVPRRKDVTSVYRQESPRDPEGRREFLVRYLQPRLRDGTLCS